MGLSSFQPLRNDTRQSLSPISCDPRVRFPTPPPLPPPHVIHQGPEGISRYDGIWRHMGIAFGAVSSGSPGPQNRASTIELYVDGKMLCGLEFPLDDDLYPQ